MHTKDGWAALRRFTAARIALGRAGGSLPTASVLEFAVAHAAARDAVHGRLDVDALRKSLFNLAPQCLSLVSRASDRDQYLKRPDLGRQLDEASKETLRHLGIQATDIALIVADGLCASAAQNQAVLLLRELLPKLRGSGLSIAPLCIVGQARVAIEDEIGALLGARLAVILIGERPGLVAPESLGAYLVFDPRPGRSDAQRNCVSNIRPGGLPHAAAADTLHYLILQSLRRQMSGVALKDDRPQLQSTGQIRRSIRQTS